MLCKGNSLSEVILDNIYRWKSLQNQENPINCLVFSCKSRYAKNLIFQLTNQHTFFKESLISDSFHLEKQILFYL